MISDDDDKCKLYICRAAKCRKNGSDELVDVLERVLKTKIDQNSETQEIKLESTLCLGQCPHGPNVKANNKIYNRVDRQQLKKILAIIKSRLFNNEQKIL